MLSSPNDESPANVEAAVSDPLFYCQSSFLFLNYPLLHADYYNLCPRMDDQNFIEKQYVSFVSIVHIVRNGHDCTVQ